MSSISTFLFYLFSCILWLALITVIIVGCVWVLNVELEEILGINIAKRLISLYLAKKKREMISRVIIPSQKEERND